MAFVVKNINLDDLDSNTGEYTYERKDADGKDISLNITFKSFNNPQFQKAYNMLVSRERADSEAVKGRKLDETFLDDIADDEKTTDEMLVRAIGKFLIVDWDVQDEQGNKLEITADNFILLIANLENAMGFTQWCLDSATDVTIKNAKSLADTKKKPLSVTSGKKTTKASATSTAK